MRIAIPIPLTEGKNSVWVLRLYTLIFGFSLPALVGRWWFDNQKKTEDGMNAKTAASFFLSAKEEWGIDELVSLLGKGFANELQLSSGSDNGSKELEAKVREGLGWKWGTLADAAGVRRSLDSRFRSPIEDTRSKPRSPGRYVGHQPSAHFKLILGMFQNKQKFRYSLPRSSVLLNICLSQNWLIPSLATVQLSARLTQAVPPHMKTIKESDKD